MVFLRVLALLGIATAGFCVAPALAQDLPPVAAPTTTVSVGALPIVSSESEQVEDFASGLIRGLTSANRVAGVVFVAVKADHVMAARGFGASVDADTSVAVASLTDVFRAVAIMQLVDQRRIATDDDMSKSLGETTPRGLTVSQALLRSDRVGADLLTRAIEKISGEAFPAYVMKHIFAPLGMTRSGFGASGFTTTANDASHFLLALTNGGAWGQERILLPETLDRMQRAHDAEYPAAPGSSYGFAEESRNGWRALQDDGMADGPPVQSRIVFAPEARLAYLVVVMGRADTQFWRTLDDSLYDRLLPPRTEVSGLAGAAPGAAEAGAASGTYIPGDRIQSAAAFLKTLRRPLYVEARGDGTLVLSGAEKATLMPHAGGFWLSEGTELPAVYQDGHLNLGDITYVRFHVWERPGLYAWLAVLAGLVALLALADPVKTRTVTRLDPKWTYYLTPALIGVMFLLVLTAVILRLLVFGA